MNSQITNNSGEVMFVLPAIDSTSDFCNNLAGLGTLQAGGVFIDNINDIWDAVAANKLFGNRWNTEQPLVGLFNEYGVIIPNSTTATLPNALNPFGYIPPYWNSLKNASNNVFFITNPTFTKAAAISSPTSVNWTISSDRVSRNSSSTYYKLSTGNCLWNGGFLRVDEVLNSSNNAYYLIYKSNGVAAVVRNSDGVEIWTSSSGYTAGQLVMQPDGNLVIYDGDNDAVWSSGIYGPQYSGAYLVIGDDGVLRVYSGNGDEIWDSV